LVDEIEELSTPVEVPHEARTNEPLSTNTTSSRLGTKWSPEVRNVFIGRRATKGYSRSKRHEKLGLARVAVNCTFADASFRDAANQWSGLALKAQPDEALASAKA
jgi:hypothetical protein